MPAQDKSKIIGNRLGVKRLTNINFNNIIELGEYEVETTMTGLNTPLALSTSTFWQLSVWKIDNNPNDVMQTVSIGNITNTYFTNVYRRFLANNVWTEWYQIAGSGLDMPSNKVVDLGKPVVQQVYTSNANGWISCSVRATAANQYLNVSYRNSNLVGIESEVRSVAIGQLLTIFFPVSKGQTYRLDYDVTSTETLSWRLIYANSDVPMSER